MFSSLPSFRHAAASSSGADQSPKTESSLTTVLPTASARTELTLLLARITDGMRKDLENTFSASLDSTPDDFRIIPPTRPSSSGVALSKEDRQGKKEDDRAWIEFVKSDIADQEKVKQELEKRRRDLSTEGMVEMKRKCLSQFDTWREKVLMRVGEVINDRKHAEEQITEVETDHQAEHEIAQVRDTQVVAKALHETYPPTETTLEGLPRSKKALILHSMLLLLLSLVHYSAWSRVLLLHMTSSLGLPMKLLVEDEAKIAKGLLKATDMTADTSTQKAADDNAFSRKWKVGLATVAGAAVIGITGGLAAPLLAAGVGSVMGGLGLGATATAGYLGTLAGSSVLVGGLFGAYGGKMTGEMMDQYAKEVEDFAFIPVRNSGMDKDAAEIRRLRVTIGVSGWLSEADDVDQPWKVLGTTSSEVFALRFELKALLALGNALSSLLRSTAWSYAKSEIIKRTVFASITAALWPLALLKVSRVIDNPFSVAKVRAEKAGEVLADAIINRAQGERPVSLIGYSLGARVVYICLKKLAERDAFGLVEDVVLLGAPTPSDELDWRVLRSVAAGRVVNVYSTEDYILGFLYRSSSVQLGVAGLQEIKDVKGVESEDFSARVQGHTSWKFLVGRALQELGIEDLDGAEVERQARLGEREKAEEESGRERAARERKDGGDAMAAEDEKKLADEIDRKNASIGVGHDDTRDESRPATERQVL